MFEITPVPISSPADARAALKRIGPHRMALRWLQPKTETLCLQVRGVPWGDANILKQEMLALGGDAAVPMGTTHGESSEHVDVLLIGTRQHLRRLTRRLDAQPPELKHLAGPLRAAINNMVKSDYELATRSGKLALGSRTYIMGVLNTTPDSFSDGGKFTSVEGAVAHAKQMLSDGADIIDIGGESTRPGSDKVSSKEEAARVIPVIAELMNCNDDNGTPIISVDTQKAEVARKAIDAGAAIINDVSGLMHDPELADVAAETNTPIILNHMRGTPDTMQDHPVYNDVIADIIHDLGSSSEIACSAGVSDNNILIDPGLGFGKRFEDNLIIIKKLAAFKVLGHPLVVGPSRKSFIGVALGGQAQQDPMKRLEGTAAASALAIRSGAHILRVHDVAQMVALAQMTDAIERS